MNSRKKGLYKAEDIDINSYPSHVQTLAQDLHITGHHSIFNLIDETLTSQGRKALLKKILMPNMNKEEIIDEQNLIKELNKSYWPLIKLRVANLGQKNSDLDETINEVKRPLVTHRFHLLLSIHYILFALVWTLVTLSLTGTIPLNPIFVFTLYLLFSLATRAQVAHSFRRAHGLSSQLLQLLPIIRFIENQNGKSLFKKYFKHSLQLKLHNKLKKLQLWMAFLSVEGHPMVHIVLNALCPWDYTLTYLVEKWRSQIAAELPSVIDEISYFEVLMSQTLFYHFLTSNFPSFSDNKSFSCKNLIHPLISQEIVVGNDFNLPIGKQIILITGSNMSGKSTFLRAFGVNQVLALCGCPVFADQFETHLAPLRTCLKVQDSLEQGLSTFYYEVRQVAGMVNAAKNRENFIFLIDEIFRGTNNRERLIGSKAVIHELLQYSVFGIISTHDLELTQLESTENKLVNFHFRDDMGKDELVFNYKIQAGPCPTTNALKIIAKEGIPVDIA
ncbi:MAG: hypothetical protein H6625_10750 [Bdellovibrionaceae bacterium]|nr:hypothetical protein [Pseudobdellovibrionaceae bacterium]